MGFVWMLSMFCIFMIHSHLCIFMIHSPHFKSKFNFSFLSYPFFNIRLILRYIKTQSQLVLKQHVITFNNVKWAELQHLHWFVFDIHTWFSYLFLFLFLSSFYDSHVRTQQFLKISMIIGIYLRHVQFEIQIYIHMIITMIFQLICALTLTRLCTV